MQRKSDYHKLLVWQKGKEFVKLIYQITESFPKSETLGLQSQIRRAVVSVVLNIAEGHRRNSSQKEFLRFLGVADASLVEVEACMEIALDLGFMTIDNFELAKKKREELAVMLIALIKRVQSNL